MRTLSLFFVPALGLTYFAGTQYPSGWSFALMGGATAFLFLLISEFYRIALDPPTGTVGISVEQVSAILLFNTMCCMERDHELESDTSVYVATNESGIVPAHDIFMARFDGQKVLIIGSDLKKRREANGDR